MMKSVLSLFILTTLHLTKGSQLRGLQQLELQTPGSLLCKMYIAGTMFDDGDATEEQVCAPVVDGSETEYLIPLGLPQEIQDVHQVELRQGILLVELTNAEILRRGFDMDIAVHPSNEFIVVNDDPRLRHLRERKLQTTGDLSVAIVRISTQGSSPTATRQQLEATFNEGLVNIKTQYDLCSNRKLNLVKASNFVVDVSLNTKIGSSTTPAALIAEASEKLGGAHNLADKVFFCIPPGTGTWAASSSMNYWRAQFNDPYCTSVSAMAHEFGHLIGLPHSNEHGDKYGDSTGYMSRSYRNANWPRRCFNGANSAYLGWYKDKTLDMSDSDSPRLVKLAGVVDYGKAAGDEPVLINIGNSKWVQYNRAKWFNENTGEYPDHVIVTQRVDGGTDVVGTVLPGETFAFGDFQVKSCRRVEGENENNADYMLISVGKGTDLSCPTSGSGSSSEGPANNGNNGDENDSSNNSEVEESTEKETPFPTETPIRVPTKPPTRPPSESPTISPATTPPTIPPTTMPTTDSPTKSPVSAPASTRAPTVAPVPSKVDDGGDSDGHLDGQVGPSVNVTSGWSNWWDKFWSLPEKWFSF